MPQNFIIIKIKEILLNKAALRINKTKKREGGLLAGAMILDECEKFSNQCNYF